MATYNRCMNELPIYRDRDGELVGYVRRNDTSWECLTIFGYVFSTENSEADAKRTVENKGLEILMGTWEYLDQTRGEWFPCTIIEVSKQSVRVARMDGFYPDTSKTYLLSDSLNQVLRK